jgi:hypothetical protein
MVAQPSPWSILVCSTASTTTPPSHQTWYVVYNYARACENTLPMTRLSDRSTVRQVGMAPRTAFKARDLFAKVDLGAHPTGAFQAMLDATSILMLKLTPL